MIKERVAWVDWAKAIGIYLVVLGHFKLQNPDINGYIYMFHMPLFFFLSGYLSNCKNCLNFWEGVKDKAKRLIIPYYLFQFICGLWLIVRLYVGGNKFSDWGLLVIGSLLVDGNSMFVSPPWFLWCLFFCFVLLYGFKWRKYNLLVLLGIFIFAPFHPKYFTLSIVPIAFLYFGTGYFLKRYINIIAAYLNSHNLVATISSLFAFVIVGLVYLWIGNMDMAKGELTTIPLLSLLTAYFGIYGVCALCTLLPSTKAISAVATSTLLIMCIHDPVFWFVHLHFFDIFTNIFISVVVAAIIVSMLTLVNPLIKKYCPILIGAKKSV